MWKKKNQVNLAYLLRYKNNYFFYSKLYITYHLKNVISWITLHPINLIHAYKKKLGYIYLIGCTLVLIIFEKN